MRFLKYIFCLGFTGFTAISFSQPSNPILRIETGMHNSIGRRMATEASGRYILTCSDDKTARLWDAATGNLLNTLRIPVGDTTEGRIYACAITPDAKIAALAGQTGFEWNRSYCIYLLNVQTGDIIHRIDGLPGAINDIEFSPDGRWMATGLVRNNGVRIFDTHSWEEYKKLENYTGPVNNIGFSPKGDLATASSDGKLRLYDSSFQLVSEKIELAGKNIISVAFNPAGNLLAVGYRDTSAIEVRNIPDLSLLYTPSVKESERVNGGFQILGFSNDGSRLYGGGNFFKQDKDSTWKVILRCWNDAGKASYTDLFLMKNAIVDIKPLPNGVMAVMGSFPDIATVFSYGKINWYLSAGNNDLASESRSHFRINAEGSSIGFTPRNEDPYSFDLLKRKLQQQQSEYSSFVDTMAGTAVKEWKENLNPSINGNKILFLIRTERCFSTDISSDGQQIILGGSRNLYLSNTKGERLWKTPLPGIALAVNISGNDKIVAAVLSDGTIRWYSMADGKELLAFYLHTDKKRWILFTSSGYYDASPGAEDLLGWHFNNGPEKKPSFYPVSRFRNQFYRPDIINAIFETYNENLAISLANQRKGIGNPSTDLTIQKLPPTISINSPENGSSVSTGIVSIKYSISTPEGAPAKSVKVFVDGRPVPVGRGGIVENQASSKIDVPIPEKDCRISLVADNDNGTSPEVTLYIKWAKPKETIPVKPNLYVLAIGISNYTYVNKLSLAAKDANDFSNTMLQQKGRFYNNVLVKKLTDKEATRANIMDALEWVEKNTSRKDVAMIYFAGHGVNDEKDIYYMLPVEAEKERLKATCISFSAIKETQSHIEGRVIIFIDACHSGNIVGAGGNYINGVVNLLTSTVNGAGAIVFTSSTGNQESLEDRSWGNGAFTKALIEGLNGAALLDKKKEISYKSLDLYISDRVLEITGNRQQTTCVPSANTPNFSIALSK